MLLETQNLKKRLEKALVGKSLRQIAKDCEVSHEIIRKLSFGNSNPTLDTFNKVSKGLSLNGF